MNFSITQYTANSTLVWDGEQCDRRGGILDGGAAVARRVKHATPRVLNQNRLISATLPDSTTVSYVYDSQSRRIASTTSAGTTLTIYDGWNPIAEYSTSDFTTLDFKRSYLWGMDLSGSMQGAGGVGGLLAVTQDGSTYYPTFDANGNVSEYLNSTGAIVAHYEYDPFGRTTIATGTKAQDFSHRFSTKPLDKATGLYYYGYRYYDPQTGRWPSRDPIEENGGINLYGFVGNDGVNWLDDLGHGRLKWPDFIKDVFDEIFDPPSVDKAISEQGEIALEKAQDQRRQINDLVDDYIDIITPPVPQAPPTPTPPHPHDYYSCNYDCEQMPNSDPVGEGNSCAYGNCQLVSQSGPMRGNSMCPAGSTIGLHNSAPHTNDDGCKFCPATIPVFLEFGR